MCSPRHSILAYHVVILTACCKYRWRDESSETDEIQIYATSEERKQRNRQAQAAFRERRTEYIKQLENTIKHHEETLQTLQQSHRNAADECLMLRYKNSLLERILLEKGTSSDPPSLSRLTDPYSRHRCPRRTQAQGEPSPRPREACLREHHASISH